jgi:DNA-binding NtrC family response regulator
MSVAEHESRMHSGARELVAHEVLAVDRDDATHRWLLQLLAPAGLHLTAVVDPAKALALVGQKYFAVVIVDLDTPSAGGGLALIEQVRERSPQSTIVALTADKAFEGAVDAFRRGVVDVVWKSPSEAAHLKERVLAVVGSARRRDQRDELLADVHKAMDELLKTLMAEARRATEAEERLAGLDPARLDAGDDVRIICVDADDRLFKAVKVVPGFTWVYAQSGGEALDRITNSKFQIALCGPTLHDMPADMVLRAIKAQAPELIVISYVPGGKLEIVESTRRIPVVDKFTKAEQLVLRLNELAEAHRVRARERRYLQAFRERHFEFLRRFAELRQRVEKAL